MGSSYIVAMSPMFWSSSVLNVVYLGSVEETTEIYRIDELGRISWYEIS